MFGSTLINHYPTLRDVTTMAGQRDDGSALRGPNLADDEAMAAQMASVFKALGSPIRLRLLALIQATPEWGVCVCDLVDGVGVTQPTVSHHLGVLMASGLVRRERRGNWAWYILEPDALESVRELLATGSDVDD
jgi:ArsR family transcriptional regulator